MGYTYQVTPEISVCTLPSFAVRFRFSKWTSQSETANICCKQRIMSCGVRANRLNYR